MISDEQLQIHLSYVSSQSTGTSLDQQVSASGLGIGQNAQVGNQIRTILSNQLIVLAEVQSTHGASVYAQGLLTLSYASGTAVTLSHLVVNDLRNTVRAGSCTSAAADAQGGILQNSAIFCLVDGLLRANSYTSRVLTVIAGHGYAETTNLRERTALVVLNGAVEYAQLQVSAFDLILAYNLTSTAAYAGFLVKIKCFSCHCYTSPLH